MHALGHSWCTMCAMRLRLVAATCPLAAVVVLLGTPAPAGAAVAELRLSFDAGEPLVPGSRVVDGSGAGRHGTVVTSGGGTLTRITGWRGSVSARFPSPCSGSSCPKAIVEVPSGGLLMGTAPFEWGARVRLPQGSTSAGENLVQKGLYTDPAGQWKLQVDGSAGRPSCVVSGYREDGSFQRVTVAASMTVADGAWHHVLCRRSRTGVSVLVDGQVRGRQAMRPVRLVSDAPVRVGGKGVQPDDNDQFFGTLDEVVVRRL